ncbi:putative squalene monooxygenase [Rosa chinensis]|uniref:Squalene monooxygenase n=1 Tax=Rosa chinensis TaxID=74649 RepID=A0A2P6P1H3_ROSCH|nr:putative squalene monooxygenase [Rosa chinensis]
MDYLYTTGAVIASLLSVVFLYTFRGKRKNVKASMKTQNGKLLKSSGNGMCLPAKIGTSPDIVIVGAGVVGSALAYTLGKDGRQVHVIERDLTEPDRIVGELLQPGGYLRLIELGLEDCVNEIDAQTVFGYALYKDGKSSKLPYPLENFHPDVAGRSFHHGRFIQRMREKAASLPSVRLEQGTVTSLLEEQGTVKGVQYKSKGSDQELTAHAPLTIVCDGCYSNLRRSLCDAKVDIPSCFVGLVLENCQLPYANHGHVILADPSPILFYPISSTEIRCLVDVPGQKVPSISSGDMAHYLKTKVAPQVPLELHAAFLAAIDNGNIKSMPNRSMPAAPHPRYNTQFQKRLLFQPNAFGDEAQDLWRTHALLILTIYQLTVEFLDLITSFCLDKNKQKNVATFDDLEDIIYLIEHLRSQVTEMLSEVDLKWIPPLVHF